MSKAALYNNKASGEHPKDLKRKLKTLYLGDHPKDLKRKIKSLYLFYSY
jgi:hypothetical protein